MSLRRFWLEFEITDADWRDPARRWNPLRRHVGVTGWDLSDCLDIVRDWFYAGAELPPLTKVEIDVDVSSLSLPGTNRGVPAWRGVWWPPDNLNLPTGWPRGPGDPPAG